MGVGVGVGVWVGIRMMVGMEWGRGGDRDGCGGRGEVVIRMRVDVG